MAVGRMSTAQCAHAAGIGQGTWSAYVTRGQAPKPDGRRRDTGAPYWHRATYEAWAASRPGHEHADATLATHDRIAAADGAHPANLAPLSNAALARELGLSAATVTRHRKGACRCAQLRTRRAGAGAR